MRPALDKPDWLMVKVNQAKRFVEQNYSYQSIKNRVLRIGQHGLLMIYSN